MIDREQLPKDWPTSPGEAAFWTELGRAVATFTFLEDTLARAHFALTATRRYDDFEQANAAYSQWMKQLEQSLTDSLNPLTDKIEKAFEGDNRVPPDIGASIVARLRELRVWRNALCHGTWENFATDGSAHLRHFRKGSDGPEQLQDRLTLETISSIRAETTELTISVVDIVAAAGVRLPGSALPGFDAAASIVNPGDRDANPV